MANENDKKMDLGTFRDEAIEPAINACKVGLKDVLTYTAEGLAAGGSTGGAGGAVIGTLAAGPGPGTVTGAALGGTFGAAVGATVSLVGGITAVLEDKVKPDCFIQHLRSSDAPSKDGANSR